MIKRFICAALASALCFSAAFGLTRDALRQDYRQLALRRSHASPYLEAPDLASYSTAGTLTDAAQQEALDYLNFLRRIAGLEPVALSPLYIFRSQNGALLLAANDQLNHNPPPAEGMDQALYESALLGTSLGNIAKFNWMRPEILLDGVEYFARDDGDFNLSTLGHRRWLLNPYMAQTGFGLANAISGMSYVTMYAVDDGNADARWDSVCWPAAEAFPVELMRRDLAWSISLNDDVYDLAASAPVLTMTELSSGAVFRFDFSARTGDGFCLLNSAGYGSGSCLIFRPELQASGIGEYVQNQRWQVQLIGLVRRDGSAAELSYVSEMTALNPQDVVNVEIWPLTAELNAGDTLQLQASVIPAYADDLSVSFESDNPAVAQVDAYGLVSAVGSGSCSITVRTVNGRTDACSVTVR